MGVDICKSLCEHEAVVPVQYSYPLRSDDESSRAQTESIIDSYNHRFKIWQSRLVESLQHIQLQKQKLKESQLRIKSQEVKKISRPEVIVEDEEDELPSRCRKGRGNRKICDFQFIVNYRK